MHRIYKMRFLVLFLLCCNFSQAQKLSRIELLDAISNDICSEIATKNIKVINENVLGVQMIKSLMNYKEDVVFYFGQDYFINEKVMETLGEEIGTHLGIKCPEIFLDIIDVEEAADIFNYITVKGKLSKIQNNEFMTFTIKETTGKTHEFMLLSSFETAYLLTDNILKANDEIEVSYYVSEIYNAKIGRYINYNIVTYIEKK